MNRPIEIDLFEALMCTSRKMKHQMFAGGPGGFGPRGPMPPHGPGMGPGGCGPRGPMPPRGPGMGPEGFGPHGPEGCRPHGPGMGPGPHHGPLGRGPLSRERVLTALLAAEDGLRQKALAEQLRVNPSSMSEFIDRLESDGYIVRTVDPADKRATLITLTEKGQARACELEDEHAERITPLFAALTDDEKAQLLALLNKIAGAE